MRGGQVLAIRSARRGSQTIVSQAVGHAVTQRIQARSTVVSAGWLSVCADGRWIRARLRDTVGIDHLVRLRRVIATRSVRVYINDGRSGETGRSPSEESELTGCAR